MSDYHIYIKMPSYLRQWFVHRHSGTEPVRLRNGSIESKLIKLAVVKPPVSAVPTRQREDEVAICIPYSKTRDPRIYNHITDTGKRALLDVPARLRQDRQTAERPHLSLHGTTGHQGGRYLLGLHRKNIPTLA